MRIHRLLPLTLIAFLAACPGDSTSPNSASGAFSFSYSGSGVGTGAFNVSGTIPTTAAQLNNQDGAGAAQNSSHNAYDVLAVHARGSGKYDSAVLQTARLTVGSTNIDANCNPATSNCAEFGYTTNASFTAQTFDEACALASGTITVTEVTNTRVKGTFAGQGVCVNQSQNVTTIAATSGSFDVPILASIPQSP